MRNGTAFQLRRNRPPDNVVTAVTDPTDISDGVTGERLSLDVRQEDAELLMQFASYKNALAAVQGKKLRKKWTRKSLAESFLAAQCDALRIQLAEMLKDLGDLPDSKDEVAMAKYAKRVLAWTEKHSK